MIRARTFGAFILVTALAGAPAVAENEQPNTAKPRPKIGLALAGGSALGFAHIGVLDWLEKHRIPVDFIAGTSMGGLVGGLYATGADAGGLREFLQSVHWDEALLAYPPYRQLHFRRKEDRREFPTRLELGLRHGVRLPSGLSPGHGVGLVLSRFAAPYPNLASFDDLPTPFRCVAVDLTHARKVVFDKGDLFTALRATMAIPTIFTAVRRGDEVLVDGGVVDNLPVDVVRKMGADIVIAVSLHGDLPPRTGDLSILQIADRAVDVSIAANELRSMADADIVLIPDLAGITFTEFERATEFIERGFQAAEKKTRVLDTYALPPAAYHEYVETRKRKRPPIRIQPQFVEVKGLTAPLARNLEERLTPLIESPFSRARLNTELTRLTGLGPYASAHYSFIERGGETGLLVRVEPKRYGPPFLNTMIEIDGASNQDVQFGIGGRLTFIDLLGIPGAEWRSDFTVGPRNFLGSEIFYRIRGSKWFAAPRAFIDQRSFDLFQQGDPLTRARARESGGALDFGYAAGRFIEYRFGYQFSHVKDSSTLARENFRQLSGSVSRLRFRFAHEGQDSPLLPTEGFRAVTNLQWIIDAPLTRRQFPVAEVDLGWAHRLGTAYAVQSRIAGGASIGGDNYFSPFYLGGTFRLAALGRNQYIGSNYYFADAALLRRIFESQTSLLSRMYAFAGAEAGRAFYRGGSGNPFFDGKIGIAAETALGVIYFGGAVGEQGERKVFFRLGRAF